MIARPPGSRPPLDRGRPPEPGPARTFRFPHFERSTLRPGLELVAAPSPDSSLLCLHLLFEAGAEYEDLAGLASLTASMVDEGTRQHDALGLATRIEGLGASLGAEAGWNAASISFLGRIDHLGPGLDLLIELALEATFPEHELERCRQQRTTELLRRRDSPAVSAELALLSKLYGSTPYGRSILGTQESITALSQADLVSFYARQYQGRPRTLIAVGNLELSGLTTEVRNRWGSLSSESPDSASMVPSRAALVARLAPRERPQRHVVVVDRPEAPQTELRIGQVGLERGHPDQWIFRLATTLLGGKYTSRLNRNLRERHGYTYGVNASLAARRGPAPFVISTAIANPVVGAACAEILSEVARLRDEPVPAAELAETAQYLIGTFPFTLQGVEERAGRLEDLTVFDLPDDHFDRWLAGVAACGPEELGRVARAHLSPEALSIVAVGPANELVPQLERWGAVEVLSAG